MKTTLEISIIEHLSQIKELESDIIIDGLIGTSMKGVLRSPFHEIVQIINKSKAYKISIDVPTGMDANTGIVDNSSVNADTTITFHKPKQGFLKMPKELGKLVTRKIGIPYEAEKFVGPGDISLVHPNRTKHSHKGQHGRLLIIGGNETYSGAPALTGLAAYSTGIDLVYIAAPETAAKIIAGFSPSLITLKLNGDYFSTKNIKQVEDMLNKVDAVALGPGLGLKKETVYSISKIIEKIQLYDLPIIIDADGLKAFSETRVPLKTPTVFTPHSREFQKLTGKKIPQDFVTKAKLVEEEAMKLNSIIVLKGGIDIISNGVITRYNLTGNPGMTVGGSGDVLTGIISGFIAMGSNPFYSSCAAAFINGESGDKVFEEKGFHILPEDLISKIPLIIQKNIRK